MTHTGDILKIDVHTDVPGTVITYGGRWESIGTTNARDMMLPGPSRRIRYGAGRVRHFNPGGA